MFRSLGSKTSKPASKTGPKVQRQQRSDVVWLMCPMQRLQGSAGCDEALGRQAGIVIWTGGVRTAARFG
ncbi:hypothetical protein NL676_036465 [Syzygium grande]|nr:hypothetical protein NL676_036465 [Syzygium grande]